MMYVLLRSLHQYFAGSIIIIIIIIITIVIVIITIIIVILITIVTIFLVLPWFVFVFQVRNPLLVNSILDDQSPWSPKRIPLLLMSKSYFPR